VTVGTCTITCEGNKVAYNVNNNLVPYPTDGGTLSSSTPAEPTYPLNLNDENIGHQCVYYGCSSSQIDGMPTVNYHSDNYNCGPNPDYPYSLDRCCSIGENMIEVIPRASFGISTNSYQIKAFNSGTDSNLWEYADDNLDLLEYNHYSLRIYKCNDDSEECENIDLNSPLYSVGGVGNVSTPAKPIDNYLDERWESWKFYYTFQESGFFKIVLYGFNSTSPVSSSHTTQLYKIIKIEDFVKIYPSLGYFEDNENPYLPYQGIDLNLDSDTQFFNLLSSEKSSIVNLTNYDLDERPQLGVFYYNDQQIISPEELETTLPHLTYNTGYVYHRGENSFFYHNYNPDFATEEVSGYEALFNPGWYDFNVSCNSICSNAGLTCADTTTNPVKDDGLSIKYWYDSLVEGDHSYCKLTYPLYYWNDAGLGEYGGMITNIEQERYEYYNSDSENQRSIDDSDLNQESIDCNLDSKCAWVKDFVYNPTGNKILIKKSCRPKNKVELFLQSSIIDFIDTQWIDELEPFYVSEASWYDEMSWNQTNTGPKIIGQWGVTGRQDGGESLAFVVRPPMIGSYLNSAGYDGGGNCGDNLFMNIFSVCHCQLSDLNISEVSLRQANDNYEDWIPDADVRTISSLTTQTKPGLFYYWDKELHPEQYEFTSAPAEVQFYLYPRTEASTEYNNFKVRNVLGNNDSNTNDNFGDNFYITNLDWGDGSTEYMDESKNINISTILKHNYTKPGIYNITGYMYYGTETEVFAFKSSNNINKSIKRFVIKINLNETDKFNDFTYLGADNYTFIPYKETTPIIGGISSNSIYQRVLQRQLGYHNNTQVMYNTIFQNYYDKLRAENALALLDENKILSTLNIFTKSYFDNSVSNALPGTDNYGSSFEENGTPVEIFKPKFNHFGELGNHLNYTDIAQIRYFNEPKSMWEMLGFEEPNIDDFNDALGEDLFNVTMDINNWNFNDSSGGNAAAATLVSGTTPWNTPYISVTTSNAPITEDGLGGNSNNTLLITNYQANNNLQIGKSYTISAIYKADQPVSVAPQVISNNFYPTQVFYTYGFELIPVIEDYMGYEGWTYGEVTFDFIPTAGFCYDSDSVEITTIDNDGVEQRTPCYNGMISGDQPAVGYSELNEVDCGTGGYCINEAVDNYNAWRIYLRDGNNPPGSTILWANPEVRLKTEQEASEYYESIHPGSPSSPRYWKNIVPQNFDVVTDYLDNEQYLFDIIASFSKILGGFDATQLQTLLVTNGICDVQTSAPFDGCSTEIQTIVTEVSTLDLSEYVVTDINDDGNITVTDIIDMINIYKQQQTYYYPVLPNVNQYGRFDESLGLRNNNTPFGSERNWNQDDTEAPITNENYRDDSLLIDIKMDLLEQDVLEDNSGNKNVGMMISDYRIEFDNQTLEPTKGQTTKSMKIETTNKKAF